MSDDSKHLSEINAIIRAYTMLSIEAGHVASVIALYEELLRHYGTEKTNEFLRTNGREFPILAAMADENTSYRINKRISNLNSQLSEILKDKTNIVCIGAETAWIDIAARTYSNKQFHIVPQSQHFDFKRFLSNYSSNVRIHNSVDLTQFYGTNSVIVAFAFGTTQYNFYTYPVAYRICGSDTRQFFSELIALDLMDCPLKFYPNDLAEIPTDEMTYIFSRSYKQKRRYYPWKLAA